MSDASQALDQVKQAYDIGTREGHEQVIGIATEAWGQVDGRLPDDQEDCLRLGEVYRRAAIAAVALERPEPALWRARSLAMFSSGGSPNGIAMLVLASAMGALGAGHKVESLKHFEVMRLLVDDADAVIDADLVRSAAFENEGIAHLFEPAPDTNAARSALEKAMEFETDARRLLKLRASVTTADYLDGNSGRARDDLQAIIQECNESKIAGDVIETADKNLGLMADGAPSLLPYQVI